MDGGRKDCLATAGSGAGAGMTDLNRGYEFSVCRGCVRRVEKKGVECKRCMAVFMACFMFEFGSLSCAGRRSNQ